MVANNQYEGDNIGGIAKLEIAHVQDFKSFNPVSFHPNKFWKEITFHPNSGLLKDEVNDSDHGQYYSYAASVKITHRDKELEQIIDRLIGQCSVIRVTDMNGYRQVIGSPEAAVLITRSGDTGSAPTDVNQYILNFTVSQPERALFG